MDRSSRRSTYSLAFRLLLALAFAWIACVPQAKARERGGPDVWVRVAIAASVAKTSAAADRAACDQPERDRGERAPDTGAPLTVAPAHTFPRSTAACVLLDFADGRARVTPRRMGPPVARGPPASLAVRT